MRKKLSKIVKILFTILFTSMLFVTDSKSVDAAADSIKLGDATMLPGYISGTKFHIKTLKSGGYAYCLNIHKTIAQNVTEYLEGTMNAGVAYIIENGYPNKSFTGNKKKDFYITQSAVWWYLDETTGSSNLSSSFKGSGSDTNNLRPYIKKLVSGAKKAKDAGYTTPSVKASISDTAMTLTKDGNWYVSKAIDANAKNIDGKYKVSITSAPEGTVIIDTEGKAQTKFSSNEKFKVGIPVSSIKEGKTVTAKVKITASSTINKAYKYAPKDSSIQPVAILQPYEKTVTDSISVKATRPKAPKPCSIDNGKYYGKNGDEVTKDTYTAQCEPPKPCSIVNGNYYGKNGDLVSKDTYTTQCEAPKPCSIVNGKYYGKNGDLVTIDTYKNQCEATPPTKTTPAPTVVNIIKLDKDTNTPVAGAVLVVKNSAGTEVARFTSTAQKHTINNLANGTYTVEEVSAPAGYELSTEKPAFTFTDSVRSAEVKFYNKAKDSVVSITKLDKNTNNPISGAVLVVKDSNGNILKRFTSTVNGYTITGLSNGTYTVEEEKAPLGYELNTNPERFTISDSEKIANVKFYNTPKERVVTISKIDANTNRPLAGAVIVVTDANGVEVARFTSTNEAYVLRNLSDGTYTVEEVSAPEGYFVNDDVQTFTIDNEHLSYQVTITNVPKTCDNGGLEGDECYVEVPNTSSTSIPFYMIGLAIIGSGIGYVYKNKKANR